MINYGFRKNSNKQSNNKFQKYIHQLTENVQYLNCLKLYDQDDLYLLTPTKFNSGISNPFNPSIKGINSLIDSLAKESNNMGAKINK